MAELLTTDLPYERLKVDNELSLRQLTPQDANSVYELVDKDREYIKKWLPWAESQTLEDTKQFILKMVESRNTGAEYGYGLIIGNEVVGHMSLMHLADDKEPEIGYWIASKASGRGVTTKAVIALTEFGFQTLKLPKIVIHAAKDNIASNRIAEKAGYTLVETYKNDQARLANIWAAHPVPEHS